MPEFTCGRPDAPVSVNNDAAWLCRSVSQTTAEVDVHTVDLADLMRQHHPWHGLHINAECTECHEVTYGSPALCGALIRHRLS